MEKINLREKFSLFSDHWNPRVVGTLNGQEVRIAKVKGTFIWHSHQDEDELFWVHKGRLDLEFRDQTVTLSPGEMMIVPRGVEHRPVANDETEVVLFEPASTINTGNSSGPLTRNRLEKI